MTKPESLNAKSLVASGAGKWMALTAVLAAGKFGRRITYFALCIGFMASLLFLYQFNTQYGTPFLISVFIAGGITASFYGFFPPVSAQPARDSRITSVGCRPPFRTLSPPSWMH